MTGSDADVLEFYSDSDINHYKIVDSYSDKRAATEYIKR